MPDAKANSRNDKLKWWLAGIAAGMVGWYLVRLTDRIDALSDAGGVDDPRQLSNEEYAARLEESARHWPDQHLEIVVRAYCERHGLAMLGVASA